MRGDNVDHMPTAEPVKNALEGARSQLTGKDVIYPTLLTHLLTADRVIGRLNVRSKRGALQELAKKASPIIGCPALSIAAALQTRERLGSTGIGDGVAIPHARLPGLDQLFGLFARLQPPIEFAAIDNRPVDLMFLILVPVSLGTEQLGALSVAVRLLRDEELRDKLRRAPDSQSLFRLLRDAEPSGRKAEPLFTIIKSESLHRSGIVRSTL